MTNDTPQRDNLLGICHAMGETLGINPLILRVAFAAGLLFDARLTLLTYAACGVIVLADKSVAWLLRRRSVRARMRLRQFA